MDKERQLREAKIQQRAKKQSQIIQEMVYYKLKQQLKQKAEQMKDNPMNILAKNSTDNKEALGKPFVSAVQIKIVSSQINLKFSFLTSQKITKGNKGVTLNITKTVKVRNWIPQNRKKRIKQPRSCQNKRNGPFIHPLSASLSRLIFPLC